MNKYNLNKFEVNIFENVVNYVYIYRYKSKLRKFRLFFFKNSTIGERIFYNDIVIKLINYVCIKVSLD